MWMSPIIPIWYDEERERPYGDFETTHTCRNFWKVREWVLERSALKHPFNDHFSFDNLPIPV